MTALADRLAEWRALCEGATPGPWRIVEYGDEVVIEATGTDIATVYRDLIADPRSVYDAELIAAAPAVTPLLLSVAGAAREVVDAAGTEVGPTPPEFWQAVGRLRAALEQDVAS